jgi:hypothetical protein
LPRLLLNLQVSGACALPSKHVRLAATSSSNKKASLVQSDHKTSADLTLAEKGMLPLNATPAILRK